MFKPLSIATVAIVLSGCAVGVSGSGSPSTSFVADKAVSAVLDAAEAQARECLTGRGSYEVRRIAGGNASSGAIVVRAPFTSNDMARVDASDSAGNTKVDVVMWGKNIWDAEAVTAMRDAITFGVVSCKSYMPARTAKPQ